MDILPIGKKKLLSRDLCQANFYKCVTCGPGGCPLNVIRGTVTLNAKTKLKWRNNGSLISSI